MNIINKLNLKTLIIVPNTYLLNQWVDLLSKFFPNNKIITINSYDITID